MFALKPAPSEALIAPTCAVEKAETWKRDGQGGMTQVLPATFAEDRSLALPPGHVVVKDRSGTSAWRVATA